MVLQDFISQNEAEAFSGVSIQTLNRFAEAGYLRIEIDADGIRHFSQIELCEVFGLTAPAPTSCVRQKKPVIAPPLPETLEPRREAAPPASSASLELQADSPSAHPEIGQATSSDIARSTGAEIELNKLRSIVSLQEKLLDMRETQLREAKEEREWLRSRIEKLDEKGDRDQLLLLSETQTIRKLVVQSQNKRSPMRDALEWLGVLEPNSTLNAPAMIELNRESNDAARERVVQ